MVLAERDHTIETFLFDRAHEPFGVHVEIGTPRRQPNGLDPAAHQDVGHDTGVQGIPVVNEIARGPQETVNGIRERAGHLVHPRAVGLLVDAGDSVHGASAARSRRRPRILPPKEGSAVAPLKSDCITILNYVKSRRSGLLRRGVQMTKRFPFSILIAVACFIVIWLWGEPIVGWLTR